MRQFAGKVFTAASTAATGYGLAKQKMNTYHDLYNKKVGMAEATMQNAGGIKDAVVSTAGGTTHKLANVLYKSATGSLPFTEGVVQNSVGEAIPFGAEIAQAIDSSKMLSERIGGPILKVAHDKGHGYAKSAGQAIRGLKHTMTDDELQHMVSTMF